MATFHFIRQLIFSEISGIRLGNSYIYVAPPPKKKKFCAIDNLIWTFISNPATYSQHSFMWMIKHIGGKGGNIKGPNQCGNIIFQRCSNVAVMPFANVHHNLAVALLEYHLHTITFPMLQIYAFVLFKVILKFKMSATDQFHNSCGRIYWEHLSQKYSYFAITVHHDMDM